MTAGGPAGGRPGPVRVDRFRWWHIDAVLPIEADLFGVEQWSAAMFWNELANRHHYLVATGAGPVTGSGGEVLGYAGLAVAGPDEAWVQNIAVRRDAQRRGVGRALLEALLAEADARGARDVLLEVAVDNAPAQKLYAGYDFEPVGIRRGYYQPTNTDALVMRRTRD
ncbi:ribosomal protein S18-alanine N-acetyltransferase [Micromonospora sp. NBRC 101691]|uniref:ribosomal protein S18-alanine N-acetyltransferase n=1 Tax=Micromonospora sp. NBRC 101691 TaxID=3032198 RepID=UPI0024A2ABFA|nr:ribosomal protein S18-alanine N-acetyltransferase [Micromonospora sp. NBRC 101691]GLY23284.1 ribosomal-protein-alanine acetyltransferase [Micromonospora sp. NBRC 101691]